MRKSLTVFVELCFKLTFCRTLFHTRLLNASRRQGLCSIKMGDTGSNEVNRFLCYRVLSTFNIQILNVNFQVRATESGFSKLFDHPFRLPSPFFLFFSALAQILNLEHSLGNSLVLPQLGQQPHLQHFLLPTRKPWPFASFRVFWKGGVVRVRNLDKTALLKLAHPFISNWGISF